MTQENKVYHLPPPQRPFVLFDEFDRLEAKINDLERRVAKLEMERAVPVVENEE